MNEIGICSYGINIPKKRLSIDETISVWKNSNLNFIKQDLNVYQRVVLDSDEDVITLSVSASQKALRNINMGADKLESIYLGTTTSPDLFRANSTIVMDMLTSNKRYFNADIQASERSGTAALLIGYSSIKSNLSKNSLIIGCDVLNRHIAPGDLRESYIGAGASAFILGTTNIIAKFEGISSYNSNFPEQIRPEDDRFLRVPLQLNHEVEEYGFISHCSKNINNLLKELNLKKEDFDYIVLQQFNGKNSFNLASNLGFPKIKVQPSIFANSTGDIGSASPLVGLAKVLEIAKPNQRILLCSYGHSSGSDAISLITTDEILSYQKRKIYSVESAINKDLIQVTYPEAMKYEFKYTQPNITLNTFL